MIDPQTVLVAVACCVVIVAVWAWGLVREDAATARAHAAGIDLGRALEQTAAQRPGPAMPSFGSATDYVAALPSESDHCSRDADSTPSAGGRVGRSGAAIPAWQRTPNDTERSA